MYCLTPTSSPKASITLTKRGKATWLMQFAWELLAAARSLRQLWKVGEEGDGTTLPKAAPHDSSQRVFLDAIRGKRKSLTPGEYGRRALALCLAIKESSDTGTLVSVKHFENERIQIP